MLFGKPNYRVTSSSRRPSSFAYPKPPLQLPRERPTSASGPLRPNWAVRAKSGLPPITRHRQPGLPCPKSANSRLMHRNKLDVYSMTSSAAAIIDAGRLSPSALAVLRLTLIT
jgi:hypothetical protein